MTPTAQWFLRGLLVLIPLGLSLGAAKRLNDGVAFEGAFPVPIYIEMNYPQSRLACANAAAALNRGMAEDGDRLIARAEAEACSGGSRAQLIDDLQAGLEKEPANTRGWTLLAEAFGNQDRPAAARALSAALMLAPSDYYLVGRLERDSGALWDVLPSDSRHLAVNGALALWHDPTLRDYILPVLRIPGGRAMLTEAFKFEPDELRALNRWAVEREDEEAGLR